MKCLDALLIHISELHSQSLLESSIANRSMSQEVWWCIVVINISQLVPSSNGFESVKPLVIINIDLWLMMLWAKLVNH